MPSEKNSKQKELLALLVENNIIKKEQTLEIDEISQKSGISIIEILLQKNLLDSEAAAQIMSKLFGLPYYNLIGKDISERILNIFPREVAENYKIICFESSVDDNGYKIKVGVVDPENFKAFEAINFLAREEGFMVEYYIISGASFENAFKQYKSLNKEISVALKARKAEEEEKKDKVQEPESEELIKKAPVAKIVSVIIHHAIDGNASDIHIEPIKNECRIRYRIDGILHTSLVLPINIHNSIVTRIKVMSNMKLDESRIPQDGRIILIENKREFDFRVSTLPLLDNEKIVMRILDNTKGSPSLESLGFNEEALKIIKNNIKDTSGMFLVTGPTGSGKSTTIFSALGLLNKEGVNICTLEDPVEYFIKGINQSQVKPEIGYSFSTGLRSLLRQDPDIIMVGEIRDNETAELAIHAALTGHFILSTLHTNNALGAIPRLFDMKVEPFLLSSTLNTILSQRLCRKICSYCKTEDKVPSEIKDGIITEIKNINQSYLKKLYKKIDLENVKFYKGAGCPRCGNTGYYGRLAISEVIDINKKMKDLIMENKKINLEAIMETQNFITLKQDGILKVFEGITTIDELLRVLHD